MDKNDRDAVLRFIILINEFLDATAEYMWESNNKTYRAMNIASMRFSFL